MDRVLFPNEYKAFLSLSIEGCLMSAINVLTEEDNDIVGSTLLPEATIAPEVITKQVVSSKLTLSGSSATEISHDYTETDPHKLSTAYALSQLYAQVDQALDKVKVELDQFRLVPVLSQALTAPTFTDLTRWTLRGYESNNGTLSYLNTSDTPKTEQAAFKLNPGTFIKPGEHYLDITFDHVPEGSLVNIRDPHGKVVLTVSEPGRYKTTFDVDNASSFYLEAITDNIPQGESITTSYCGVHYIRTEFADYMDYLTEMMLSGGYGFATAVQLEKLRSDLITYKTTVDELLRALKDEITASVIAHTQDQDNPHHVTYDQTGAAAKVHTHDYIHEKQIIDNILTPISQLQDKFQSILDDFEDHLTAINPHGLTPEIIGAAPKNHTHEDQFAVLNAYADVIQEHVANMTNPHETTYAQVGAAPTVHSHLYQDISNLATYTEEVRDAYTSLINQTKQALQTQHTKDVTTLTNLIDSKTSALSTDLSDKYEELSTSLATTTSTLNTKIDSTASTLTQEFTTGDQNLQSQLDALETKHNKETKALTTQVNTLTSSLDTFKTETVARENALHSTITQETDTKLQALSSSTTTALTDLEEKHDQDVASLQAYTDTKLEQATLAQSAAMTRALESALAQTKSNLTSRIDEVEAVSTSKDQELEESIQSLQTKHAQDITDLEASLQADIASAVNDLSSTISQQSSSSLTEVETRLASKIDTLEEKHDTELNTLTTKHDQELRSLSDGFANALDSVSTTQSSALNDTKQELLTTIATTKSEIDSQHADDLATLHRTISTEQTTQHQALIDDYTSKIEALNQQTNTSVFSLESSIGTLGERTTRLEERLDEQDQLVLDTLTDATNQLATQIREEATTIHQEMTDGLRNEMISRDTEVLTTLRDESSRSQERLRTEIDERFTTFETNTNATLADFQFDLTSLSESQDKIQSTLNTKIDDLARDTEQDLNDLETRLREAMQASGATTLEELVAMMDTRIESAKGDVTSDFDSKLAGLRQELVNSHTDLSTMLDDQEAELQRKIVEAKTEATVNLTETASTLRDELQESQRLQTQDYIERISALRTEADTAHNVLSTSISGLDADIGALKDEHRRDIAAMTEKIETADTALQQDIDLLNSKVDDQVDAFTTRFEALERSLGVVPLIDDPVMLTLSTSSPELSFRVNSKCRYRLEVTILNDVVKISDLSLTMNLASGYTTTKTLLDGGLPTILTYNSTADITYQESSGSLKFSPVSAPITQVRAYYDLDPEHYFMTGTGIGYYIDEDTKACVAGVMSVISGTSTPGPIVQLDTELLYTLSLPVGADNTSDTTDLVRIDIYEIGRRQSRDVVPDASLVTGG